MLISRRAALAALALTVSGCAASPVVDGEPALAPSIPAPTQSPQDTATQVALTELSALLQTLVTLPAWTEQAWVTQASAQVDAHLALLSLPDPLSAEEQDAFTVEAATPGVPADATSAAKELRTRIKAAAKALNSSAAAASEADLRLTWASASAATTALLDRSVAPTEGDAAPRRLVAPTRNAALEVAISHAWALVYGLGVGLGRLSSSDSLAPLGAARLAAAKELRNELRAAFTDGVPEQPASFVLPSAMDDATTIRAGWARLEGNLLEGYASLVAADDASVWRSRLTGQVSPIQALGSSVPTWPGWVA